MELSLPAAAAQPAGAPALRDTAPPTPASEDAAGRDPLGPGRRTLALRLAQRGRLRELRAERLARLRSGSAPAPGSQAIPQPPLPEAAPSRAAAVPQPATARSVAAQPVLPQVAPAARPAPAVEAPRTPVPLTPRKAAEEDAVAALEEFLRALTGGLGEAAPAADWGLPAMAAAAAGPAAVLPFQRRDPEPAPGSLSEAAVAVDPPPAPEATPAPMPGAATAQETAPEAPETPPATAVETAVATLPEVVSDPMPETAPAIAPTPDIGLAQVEPSPVDPTPAAGLAQLPGAGPGLLWALDRAGITDIADLAGLAPEDLVERLGPIGRLIPAARWIEAARSPGLPVG